jgi:hypothetical protein
LLAPSGVGGAEVPYLSFRIRAASAALERQVAPIRLARVGASPERGVLEGDSAAKAVLKPGLSDGPRAAVGVVRATPGADGPREGLGPAGTVCRVISRDEPAKPEAHGGSPVDEAARRGVQESQ